MNLKRLIGRKIKDSEEYQIKWYIFSYASVGYFYIEDEDYDYDDNFEEQKRVFELCKQDVEKYGGVIDDYWLDDNTYEDSSYIIFHCKDLDSLINTMANLVSKEDSIASCFKKPDCLTEKQWNTANTVKGFRDISYQTKEKESVSKDLNISKKVLRAHKYEVGDLIYEMRNHIPYHLWRITKIDNDRYYLEAVENPNIKERSSIESVDKGIDYKSYLELVEKEKEQYSIPFADLEILKNHLNEIGLDAKLKIGYPRTALKVYSKEGEHITSIVPDKENSEYKRNRRFPVCFWGVQYSSPVYYEGNTTTEVYFDFDVLMNLTKEQWLKLQEMTESEYYKLHGKKK